MFNPEQVQAVKRAREAMQEAMREFRKLEAETIPAAEADFKKADEVYQNAAAAAIGNRSARGKAVEAEGLRDEARRELDGVRRAAELAKLEGQRLSDEYRGAICEAEREEGKRLLGEAQAKFHEIAARWNGFAAAVRDLVLIKKALAELGDQGATQFRFVAEQLDRWAAGRFNLEGLPAWELPEEE